VSAEPGPRRRPLAALPAVLRRAAEAAAAWAQILFGVLACVLAGLLYGAFFADDRWLTPLVCAAVLGAATGVLLGLRRWGPWLTAATVVLVGGAYAAVVVLLTSTGRSPALVLAALRHGLVDGWARMLSVGLPADVIPELLLTPVLLTFLAAFGSAWLAMRTRAVLAPLAPPLVAFVAGLAFTAARPAAHLPLTGAFLLAELFMAVLRANQVDRGALAGLGEGTAAAEPGAAPGRLRPALGRVAFGVPIVAAVVVLGVAASALLPIATGQRRWDPRALRQPQVQVEDSLSPLVRIKGQLERRPPARLFTVRLEASSAGLPVDRLRVAALDRFDGALWTSDDAYVVTGRSLPTGEPLTGRRVVVRQRVDIQGLTGPFLPTIGQPASLDAGGFESRTDVGFDPRSGVLATSRRTLRGVSYELVSQVSAPSPAELRAATPGVAGLAGLDGGPGLAGEAARLTGLPPGMPADLRVVANRATGSQGTAIGQLRSLESFLRTQYGYQLGKPGHSYGALERLLAGAPRDRRGYAEQFAAAFAVLARAKGYPTRVAVGYLLDRKRATGAGTYVVTSANAHAWPEVHFEGLGWVPFEPTDIRRVAEPSPRPDPGTDPGTGQASAAPQVIAPVVVPGLAGQGPDTGGVAGLARVVLVPIALVILLAVLLVAGIVLAKFLRRRQRRLHGPPWSRIVGAWREVLDRLTERGLASARTLTAAEVAGRAAERLGHEPTSPLGELVPLVTEAIYAHDEPGEPAVTRAWELERLARDHLDKAAPAAVRVRALVDPRPLLPRRRRAPAPGRGPLRLPHSRRRSKVRTP
jgi:hypothetical protein